MSSPLSGGAVGEVWTPKSLLEWSTEFFSQKGISTPRLDAELLLAHVLECRRLDLYLQFDRPLNTEELSSYRELVQGRARRVPVAYLIGEAGFWKLTLTIAEGCLVPRPETETLVETTLEAIAAMRKDKRGGEAPLNLLEIGTGSGAIPLAICSEETGLNWVCCDISAVALSVARTNIRRYEALLAPRGNRVVLFQGRNAEALAPGFRPHLVVSNPPYIPSGEVDQLEPEVSQVEPRMALDGGPDGLEPHRSLTDYASRALSPDGRLILEIGAEQGEALRGLVNRQAGLALVEIRRDLGGRDRVAVAQRLAG